MKILNIESSPRGDHSASIQVTNAFLDAYCALHPEARVDRLNVWEEDLPDFDYKTIGAKYKAVSGLPMTEIEAKAWEKIQKLAARFHSVDRIVMGVPMWNFAYPYKLKQLIDLVSQRGFLFSFDQGNFAPILSIPRALIVYSRGQSYESNSSVNGDEIADHQTKYIEFWLKFIGVQSINTIIVENTWTDHLKDSVAIGKKEAIELITKF